MRLQALLLAFLFVSCTASTPPERFDQPDLADAYYAAKRAGAEDPHARYAAAREQMRKMPHFSTVADTSVGAAALGRPSTAEAAVATLDPWTFLGPGNIGGRTRTLVIDPQNPAVMWSGGVSGGLWKTTDAGARWEPIGDVLANIAVNSLAIDPRDRNVLYAGTGEGYFREEVRGTGLPLRGNGIFVTRDGGTSWTQLESTRGQDFLWVNDLAVSRQDSQRLYAATRTGVWRSTNAGATWSRVLETSVKGGCLEFAQRPDTNSDYLFVSCGTLDQGTVYRNTAAESGASWTSVLSEPDMGRTSLAIAPSRPSTIYAMSASNEPGATVNQGLLAVFRSDDNGDAGSWSARVRNTDAERLNTVLLTNPRSALQSRCGAVRDNFITMGWYCNVIAVDPADHERVWAAGVDLFRSDDGGRNWGLASYWWANPTQPSFAHADHHSIVFHPQYNGDSNQTMFSASDGGVFRTDNSRAAVARDESAPCNASSSSVAFTSLNHNFGATQFYHGAPAPDGKWFIAGAQDNGTILGDVERGTDGWTMIFGGDGGYVAIDPVNPNNIYVEFQGANIQRSTDRGQRFLSGTTGLNDQFLFITPFVLDESDPKRLWTGGSRVWRSEDRAATWQPVSPTLNGLVSAIAAGDRVLVGTNAGNVYRGPDWQPSKPRDGWVSWIAFDPRDNNVVYATYAGFGGAHVWKSSDAGVTWSPLGFDLPDIPVHSIAVDPARRERLYLGTDLGVFVSLDGGATWRVENTGFAPVVTETVVIGQGARGPAVYAFTHGRGAWRAELSPRDRRRAVRP